MKNIAEKDFWYDSTKFQFDKKEAAVFTAALRYFDLRNR